MGPDFPTPAPTAIQTIAPTDANRLIDCPLQLAFSKDEHFASADRTSPKRILGIAAHAVRERAYRSGQIPVADRSSNFADLWDQEISAGHQQLITDWSPAAPPEPSRWKGYQLTKTSTLRSAASIAASIPFRSPGAQAPIAGTGLEKPLADPDHRLRGRVDRIDRVDGGLRVVDIKSGKVTDGIQTAYRRQLLLYAVLVHADTGEWPKDISIEPVTGQPITIALDPAEALEAAAEVNDAIDSYNKHLDHNSIIAAARADPETCRLCPYRTMCAAYWAAVQPAWEHRSVMGEVTEVTEHDDSVTVKLSNLAGSTEPAVNIHGLHHDHSQGDGWLACCDLETVFAQPAWRARWSSRVTNYAKPAVAN